MGIELFKHIYFRLPIIIRLLITIFMMMLLFGTVIHFMEPTQFPSIFDGVWWAFVTGATVGYGDYVPLTDPGRAVGILLILSGGGLITYYITTISAMTIKHGRNLSRGKISFKGSSHIIFVGWNERTEQLINMVKRHQPHMEIVLIDHTIREISYQKIPVHFVHGNASDDAALKQANIAEAKCAVITGDILKKEREADNYTILTTLAIRGNNKHIPIVAEMLSSIQMENALRAGANTIIRSNDFMSLLFYHEIFHAEQSKPFETIFQLLEHQQCYHTMLPEPFIQQPVQKLAQHCIKKHHIFIGIIRDEAWKINPASDLILERKDIVVTLSDW